MKIKPVNKNIAKSKKATKGKRINGKFAGAPYPSAINEDYQNEDGGFKKGNPGRPPGPNARTQFINMMMESFGPEEQKTFRKFMRNPDRQFMQGLDRIITVAGIGGGKSSSGGGAEEMPVYQVIIEGQDASTVANKEKSG